MTDLNQASTLEEDEAFEALINIALPTPIINWQKEYQLLFVKVDKHLTRAIEAESRLKIAKELLATQEIQMALWKQRHENNVRSFKEASNHLSEARRHLDVVRGTW